MRRWIDVATLTKTRNLDGSFVARAAAGLPFLLEEGMAVALVPPQLDLPRFVTVRRVALLDEGQTAEVSFREISEASLAKQMTGLHCIIERSSLPEEAYSEAPALLEGFEVVDVELGLLGVVSGLIENSAQSILQVERPDGGHGEADSGNPVLIPFVDEFILDIDFDEEQVSVSIPKGLLEL